MTAHWEDEVAREIEQVTDAFGAVLANLKGAIESVEASLPRPTLSDAPVPVEYHVVYAITRGDRFDVDEGTITFRKPPVHRLTAADLGRIRADVVKERGDGLVTANVVILNTIRLDG